MNNCQITMLFLSFISGTPINHLGHRRQYVSYYPAGCDGYHIPCYPRPESDCEIRRRINQSDWTKPVCNLDGSYREYQCEAYSRSKCWCVYDNGMMIPGKRIEYRILQLIFHKFVCYKDYVKRTHQLTHRCCSLLNCSQNKGTYLPFPIYISF